MKRLILILLILLIFILGCSLIPHKLDETSKRVDKLDPAYKLDVDKDKIKKQAEEKLNLPKPKEYTSIDQDQVLTQQKIIKFAKQYVQTIPQYQKFRGRHIRLLKLERISYEKWRITLQFLMNIDSETGKIDKGTVQTEITTSGQIIKSEFFQEGSSFLDAEECQEYKGRVVNTIGGSYCEHDEIFGGNIEHEIPYICCLSITSESE